MAAESDRTRAQAEMLVNRVRKNLKRLAPWARKNDISCYRIFDADIPELPLTIDWYEGKLHIAFFIRENSPVSQASAEQLSHAVASAVQVPPEQVFIKRRAPQKPGHQYNRISKRGQMFTVRESGLVFQLNLSDYLDTGLFLDHRRTRAMVQEMACGKHVLNLFAYTGAFSVYAAHGDAASTTSVDLSNTYLDWAEQNMAANGFRGEKHRFFRTDVFTFLKQHEPPQGGYGLAVLDPPTISRSKQMSSKLEIQRDFAFLVNRTLDLCRKDGVVFFSTNFRKFKFSPGAIQAAKIEEITSQTLPFDFRNKKIHRCWKIRR